MDLKERILQQAQTALDAEKAYQLFLPDRDFVYDHGIKFVVHHYDPTALNALSNSPKKTNPLLPPFDILHVCDLQNGANHHLIVNKFMQCRGHVVISSIKDSALQGEKLDLTDFCAFEQVFSAFGYLGMLYYNAGDKSGCSQGHKHTQFTPVDELPVVDEMMAGRRLPFLYHTKKIDGQITSEKMMSAYEELLKTASEEDPPHDSYNFIISKGCAFYIPRQRSQFKCGTLLNSFSITGNIPFGEWSDESLKKQPLSAFEYVCIPLEKND